MSTVDQDPRLATPGHAVTSPSGDFKLEVDSGEYTGDEGSGTFWRIRISDRQDRTVHESAKRFSTNFATDVLWGDDDRAWIYSADVGTYVVDRDANGTWSQRPLGPRGIADGVPAPPALLVERHARVFGPKGRAKARKIAEQQAGSTPL